MLGPLNVKSVGLLLGNYQLDAETNSTLKQQTSMSWRYSKPGSPFASGRRPTP
jgi:hypothetical protein